MVAVMGSNKHLHPTPHTAKWVKVRKEYSRPDSNVESWYVRCSVCGETDYRNYPKK